jgi:sRNA-binding protein
VTIAMERDDIERCIEALSEIYPAAFFVSGRLRRPLKIGIAKDIKADLAADPDSELKFSDIDQVLAWYTNHVGYQYACSVAGVMRVDLDGAKAGTVTESEARQAKERATEIFAQIEARKRPHVWVAPTNVVQASPWGRQGLGSRGRAQAIKSGPAFSGVFAALT